MFERDEQCCLFFYLKEGIGKTSEGSISSLLSLLPYVHCPSPEEVLKLRSQIVKPSPTGIFHICS